MGVGGDDIVVTGGTQGASWLATGTTCQTTVGLGERVIFGDVLVNTGDGGRKGCRRRAGAGVSRRWGWLLSLVVVVAVVVVVHTDGGLSRGWG